jgi:hypothetical protein
MRQLAPTVIGSPLPRRGRCCFRLRGGPDATSGARRDAAGGPTRSVMAGLRVVPRGDRPNQPFANRVSARLSDRYRLN